MSGGLRYKIAQWLERNPLTRRLVLRYEGQGPTGRPIYRNRVGNYTTTRNNHQDTP